MNIHSIKGEFLQAQNQFQYGELKNEKFKDKIDEHHYFDFYLKWQLAFWFKKIPRMYFCMADENHINSKGNVQEDLLFPHQNFGLMAKFELGIDEDYDEFEKQQKICSKMKYS